MARVQILSREEQKVFSLPPKFNFSQKEYYFKLPDKLHKFTEKLRDPYNKIYFYLLFGYYRSNSIFYTTESFYIDDIKYIVDKLQLNLNVDTFNLPTTNIHR
jgi:hypothetical protein